MGEQDDQKGRLIDRRTLLKSGLLAGGALAGGGVALADLFSAKDVPQAARAAAQHSHIAHPDVAATSTAASQTKRSAQRGHRRPNILFIMVDQMRTPQWFSAAAAAAGLMPNLDRLRRGAVSFESHYTASNDCTPARSALVTGLYTHQTGCMVTGGSTLDPGFPTWGSMLRELGYGTWWYGKWHLTHGDNHWTPYRDHGALEPYGFSGGTYPSPDGGPGQGWRVDPYVTSQFEDWVAKAPANEPWCTTVSFVNPHDIAWWYRWSDRFASEASAPSRVKHMPPNFETPKEMERRGKPRLQRSLQDTADVSFGRVPYAGPQLLEAWRPFMDLYLKLLRQVDRHIGQVMRALHTRPEIAANTVVLFSSDHGEYGSSHGMRGKGAAVYEEALRVPFIVKDLRGGALTRSPRVGRKGLTSSVDVAPLMLSIATGGNAWRRDSHYAHLAHRHDMLSMVRDPTAPGRSQVLHATDEIVTEFAIKPYAADAPLHVAAIRTPTAKFALYSNWASHSSKVLGDGQERELYDYSSSAGRMELENLAGRGGALESELHSKLVAAASQEMRERLPRRLHAAQKGGFRDYFETAGHAAIKATERRARLVEHEQEGHTLGGGLEQMLHRQQRGLKGHSHRSAAKRDKRKHVKPRAPRAKRAPRHR